MSWSQRSGYFYAVTPFLLVYCGGYKNTENTLASSSQEKVQRLRWASSECGFNAKTAALLGALANIDGEKQDSVKRYSIL